MGKRGNKIGQGLPFLSDKQKFSSRRFSPKCRFYKVGPEIYAIGPLGSVIWALGVPLPDGSTPFVVKLRGAEMVKIMPRKEKGSQKIQRIGGRANIQFDAQMVAATNVDLESRVQRGQFRSDLYYRLNVVKFALPPLRDCLEDIPLL